jgi:hypothetical protein
MDAPNNLEPIPEEWDPTWGVDLSSLECGNGNGDDWAGMQQVSNIIPKTGCMLQSNNQIAEQDFMIAGQQPDPELPLQVENESTCCN